MNPTQQETQHEEDVIVEARQKSMDWNDMRKIFATGNDAWHKTAPCAKTEKEMSL